ncbi:cell division protein FtsL [Magnetospirillum sulfuroxidans]|uniref:Cell division protein FtsL n=1 Tax=Magnetospirillum sulfuroxidans TaxID=611300 RepID=A0ABS5I9M0_9PROT|nr:cell division protein FtsL [Magnetospirillum sulfuroxidans]MBR9971125.1 cell division protein FtsL [Magnetospirillum sulfuroxidans]
MRTLIGTILSALAASVVGIGLFFVKHQVKEQESRLSELNQEIQTNQEAIHVLKAEWSFLNDPSRLKQLSEKYLDMKVMGPSQVTTLQALRIDHAPLSAVAAAPKPPSPRPPPALAETRPPPGGLR